MEGTVKKKVARNPKDLDILVKMISRSGMSLTLSFRLVLGKCYIFFEEGLRVDSFNA